MPYRITSRCGTCHQGDTFVIGNWPEHLGVFICPKCRALANVPVSDGKCPGCGEAPALEQLYDYSFAVPYLGGKFPGQLEPGPTCPKCRQGLLSFENSAHLNMRMVIAEPEKARGTWGRQYMEKQIFINSTYPVLKEFQLEGAKLFAYFNLDAPKMPFVTSRMSFPIILDIRTHIMAAGLEKNPAAFGSSLSSEEITARFLGRAKQPPATPTPS
jgi:ssDNA-binding Zn-finger/Zn-ribbon topoisomerase 1